MEPVAILGDEFRLSTEWLLIASLCLSVLLGVALLKIRDLQRQAGRELANSRELVENLSEGIYRSSLDGRQLSANRALVRLNGYDSEEEMLATVSDIGKEWYVEPRRRDEFRDILKRYGKVTDFVSEIYRHKTRERIWVSESARLVYDEDSGQPLYYEGSVREITETMNRLLLEEQFRKLVSEVPGALFQFTVRDDGISTVNFLSAGITRITGLGIEAMLAEPKGLAAMIIPEDRELFVGTIRASRETLQPWDMEFRVNAADGEVRWVRHTATPERVGDAVTYYGYMSDISLRKQNEMSIEKLAFYDPLTDLPNRRMFMDRLARAARRCAEGESTGVVLFIDLDNFKTLNDTCGHHAGDAYLIEVAGRLRRCLPVGGTVARLGGDEFVVILEHMADQGADGVRVAILTANRILATMRDRFVVGDYVHQSSASIGVVVFDGPDARPDEILRNADIAMYRAKGAGRDGVALFDATMSEAPVRAANEDLKARRQAHLRSA